MVAGGADAVGRWCDSQTVRAFRWRSEWVMHVVQASLQATGNLAHAVKLLPRLDAVYLRGDQWDAVWVGDTELSAELEHLLFPAGASAKRLDRVPAWGLRRFVEAQAAEADLVVCSLPRAWPSLWRPRGLGVFSCPIFVNLTLDISAPLESLLSGRSKKGLRTDYNKSRREGYSWRLTTKDAELERFHWDMYIPHVTRRHGSRALVATLEDFQQNWINRGASLLLLEQNGHPVAGVTVRVEGSTCIMGEEGILATVEAAGYSQGIQVGLKCAAIEFAQSRRLTHLVMGRSLARLADPVLANKLRWGAEIRPSGRSLHPEWTFVMPRVGCPLADHLNYLGLLTLSGRKPSVVVLGRPTDGLRHAAERVGGVFVVEPSQASRIERFRPRIGDGAHSAETSGAGRRAK